MLALPPNSVPLTDEFNVFPKVKDVVVAGTDTGSAADVDKVPENNVGNVLQFGGVSIIFEKENKINSLEKVRNKSVSKE